MQYFVTPDFALLCQDLPTLAVGFRRSFEFWYEQTSILNPNALELRYETFVGDFGNQMRRVIDFLQLPWSDALLEPQANAKSKSFISTPSYSQVVEPVNRKAIGRWRNYEQHFVHITPTIRPLLDRWGYEG